MRQSLARYWQAIPRPVRRPFEVLGLTIKLYVDDGCSTYAAAIAYYAIFSLVPLSLITLSVFGLWVDQERMVQWVFDQVPLEETDEVRANVNGIIERAQRFSPASLGFGVIFLFWSSTGIFSAVRKGLTAASHLRKSRSYWHGKLLDFALVPALGVLIAVSVGLTALTQVVVEEIDSIGPIKFNTAAALSLAGYVLPAMASFSMFALLYKYLPTARPAWKEVLAAAAFAMVLFELGKNLIATFIGFADFSRDTAIYAGFGTALAFLVWMFLNASILLLGAEFGRALMRTEGGEEAVDPAGVPMMDPVVGQVGAR